MSVVPLLNTLLIGKTCTYTNNEHVKGCTHRRVCFKVKDGGSDAYLCYVDLERCDIANCQKSHIDAALLHFQQLAADAPTFLFVPKSSPKHACKSIRLRKGPHGALVDTLTTPEGGWFEIRSHKHRSVSPSRGSQGTSIAEHPLKTHICKRRATYFILCTGSSLHISANKWSTMSWALAMLDANARMRSRRSYPLVEK